MQNTLPNPLGKYPYFKKAGGLLFLSGIGPRKGGSGEVPGVTLDDLGNVVSYDIKAQCHSVFRNVKNILKTAGASMEHLVDITVFLTNMKQDFEDYNQVYNQYFKDSMPCRTTIGVLSLPTTIAIELKCIAICPE